MESSKEPVTTKGLHGVPLTVTAPAGQARRAVVVIQEAFGVGGPIVEVTRRLAAQGYLAVAPHLYHRVADAPVTTFPQAQPLMKTLNGDDVTHDLTDALAYTGAAGVPMAMTGIVGFCMGGTLSLWAAAGWPFGAAVTFYGGGVSKSRWPGVPAGLESGAALQSPWLGLYGDKDKSISPAEVEQLRAIVAQRSVPTDIVRYPNAAHAFATDPTSPNYVADAAQDGWARTLAWFDAHIR